jgi:hypothetical protein
MTACFWSDVLFNRRTLDGEKCFEPLSRIGYHSTISQHIKEYSK